MLSTELNTPGVAKEGRRLLVLLGPLHLAASPLSWAVEEHPGRHLTTGGSTVAPPHSPGTLAFLHFIRAALMYSPACLTYMHYFSKVKIKLQEAVKTQEFERFPAGSAKVSEDLQM